MTIFTLDGVIAGGQPPQPFYKTYPAGAQFVSTWGLAGYPAPGSYNGTMNGGTYSSTGGLVAGQIPHFDPGGGVAAYLARLSIGNLGTSQIGHMAILCDRLWDNTVTSVTSTSLQSITSPAFPIRSAFGNHGPFIGVEIISTVGNVAPTITIGYTNGPGVAGRTATNVSATVANSGPGNFILIGLQSGDTGVKSVDSIQLSASWVSGSISVVAYWPLASISSATAGGSVDCISGGFPRLFNGVVPFLLCKQPTFVGTIQGTYVETQG